MSKYIRETLEIVCSRNEQINHAIGLISQAFNVEHRFPAQMDAIRHVESVVEDSTTIVWHMVENHIEDLRNAMADLIKEKEELEDELATANLEIIDLKNEISELNAEIVDLQNQID